MKSDFETQRQPPQGTDCPTIFRVWRGRVRTPRAPLRQGRGRELRLSFQPQNLGFRGKRRAIFRAPQNWKEVHSVSSAPGQENPYMDLAAALPTLPGHPQGQNSGAEGPVVHAFALVTQTGSRVLSPQRPRAAQGNRHQRSERSHQPSWVRSTCLMGRGLDEPLELTWLGREGTPPRTAPRFSSPNPPTPRASPHHYLPQLPKRPDAQHTRAKIAHTKPTCCGSISRLLRTLRGPGGPRSAIPQRLDAASVRGWGVPAAGVLSGAERRGLERATRGSEARGSRPQVHGPRASSAGKQGEEVVGARRGRSSESRARCARSAHHGSVARRRRRYGGAGGPGSQGWRSPGAGAATCPLSLGALARPQPWEQCPGAPAGALSAPPRAAPPLPLVASSPSKFGGGRRPAMLHCFPASRAGPAQCAQVGRQTGRAGPATLAASRLDVGPPGVSSPRDLCLRLPAPASARP